MEIEEIIKKYCMFYEGMSYTYIADKILEETGTGLSHRTLRRKVGEYFDKEEQESERRIEEIILEDDIRNLEDEYYSSSPTSHLNPYLGGNPDNVLIIGDPHEPFSREGYLEHCREQQEIFDCGTVVCIGDIVDSHYSSFHPSDPDGYGAGEELDRTIAKTREWHRIFPNAKVTIGNHDAIVQRKAFASGVSKRWIKGLGEVLETPTWEYDMEFVINDVLYTHTLGANAMAAAVNRRQSVVCGHHHTIAAIQWNVSARDRIFSMNVGCGIDDRSYAFGYAKLNSKKSIISCGVVMGSIGNIPVIVPMDL